MPNDRLACREFRRLATLRSVQQVMPLGGDPVILRSSSLDSCMCVCVLVLLGELLTHLVCSLDFECITTVWPSGLRRWLQVPVRKGVGSNLTAVNSGSDTTAAAK